MVTTKYSLFEYISKLVKEYWCTVLHTLVLIAAVYYIITSLF